MLSFLLFLSMNFSSALPNFKGLDLNSGKPAQVQLSSSQKYRVMIFLSAKCPCSVGHEKKLQKLAKDYQDSGFQFVGIHSNANEDTSVAQEHFTESNLGFPIIHDPKSKIADQFKAQKTPEVFVFDSRGKIVYQGGIDDSSKVEDAQKDYLADALKNLKEQKPVAIAETASLGCRIQRP